MTKLQKMLVVVSILINFTTGMEAVMAIDGPNPTLDTLNDKLKKTKAQLESPDYANFPFIDNATPPQQDFFTHVNGLWLKNTDIPADKGRYGSFDILRDKTEAQVQSVIEQLLNTPREQLDARQQQIVDLYNSYLDQNKRDQLAFNPLLPYLDRVNQLNDHSQISLFIAQWNKLGISSPLGVGVIVDPNADDAYMLGIAQSGLSLPDRDYYLNADQKYQTYRQQYVKHIENMFSMVGFSKAAARAQSVLEFETELAKIHWERKETRQVDKIYNKFKINQLTQFGHTVDLNRILVELGVKVEEVNLYQPDVVQKTNHLLNQTPIAVIQDYFRWKMLNALAGYCHHEAYMEQFDFYSSKLKGVLAPREPYKRAITMVDEALGESLGKEYVARFFSSKAKDKMQQLVENLREAYRVAFHNLDWMEPQTKAAALEKLENMSLKLGYPDQWRDYSGLVIDANDFFGNVMRSNAFDHEYQFAKLGKPVDRAEWLMNAHAVNAYYMPPLNEICFPAGILQAPFFSLEATDAMNYGGIGGVIAHEMGHGFDDQGRKYDKDGKLKDWWTGADAKRYEDKTAGLVEQYNAFEPIPGAHVNGELTLGENVADLTGLTIAMMAYDIAREGNPEAKVKDYTPRQQVFLNWAQVWNVKKREDALRAQLKSDPHSPGRYRCNGIVRNLDSFYDDFNVKEGDPMYLDPHKRVKLWR